MLTLVSWFYYLIYSNILVKLQRHTLTRRATLVRLYNGLRTARHGAGYEHTHLPAGVAVAVTTTIVPAVTFLIPVAI